MQIVTHPVKQNKKNAKDWPSEYSCNFLEAGLVDYSDSGAGMAMLKKETIIKMLPTFVGKPVTIDHVDVSPNDYQNHAVGYVTRTWWDDLTGWAMCTFLLTEDKAKEKVAKGYSVSCAYDQVVTDGHGGSWHAIDYDEEILSGVGNHLALVLTPRYEDCKIVPCMMLVNSKRAVIKKVENTVKLKNANKSPCPDCEGWGTIDGGKECPSCKGSGIKNSIKNATKSHPQEAVVFKPMHRICDSCEYLCSDHCDVAGKGGEITLEYAGKRLLGLAENCSAYEKDAREGRMNVKLKPMKENIVKVKLTKEESQ